MIEMINFKEWLMIKFIEWEAKQKRRQSYAAFARYLNVSQPTMSHWLSGSNPPDEINTIKLSIKLGIEVYDVLGRPRPLPFVYKLESLYEILNDDQKIELDNRIGEIIEDFYKAQG